jgi:retinol dehydrogenase 12
MGLFSNFLYSQLFVTLPKPTKDFTGQTIIVTGSNTGLGLEAARHFSRLNASLIIMAVRSLPKGEAAKQIILRSTNRPSSSIEVWELNLQSYDSVKAFVAKANQLDRIDGLLENAGIMTKHFKMVEGHESTITTNVVSTFLLALLILPKLKESALKFNIRPRITVVSSDLHFMAKFPERYSDDIFDALNDREHADMGMERYASCILQKNMVFVSIADIIMHRYSVSKLLEVLVVRELGSILNNTASKSPQIIINCLTPGACRSDFDRESTGIRRVNLQYNCPHNWAQHGSW